MHSRSPSSCPTLLVQRSLSVWASHLVGIRHTRTSRSPSPPFLVSNLTFIGHLDSLLSVYGHDLSSSACVHRQSLTFGRYLEYGTNDWSCSPHIPTTAGQPGLPSASSVASRHAEREPFRAYIRSSAAIARCNQPGAVSANTSNVSTTGTVGRTSSGSNIPAPTPTQPVSCM